MIQTPKEILDQMIANHGYKGLQVKGSHEEYNLFTLVDYIDIPEILMDFVMKNYNVIFGSADQIIFKEYPHISQEMFNSQN